MEKRYSNGKVTVIWRPALCVHSTICISGLPEVFQMSKRPWIRINDASTEQIIEQVKKCPSMALSYFLNNEKQNIKTNNSDMGNLKIEILKNGPYLVKSKTVLLHSDGSEQEKEENFALCRCGGSGSKPFCDGTHHKNGFNG